MKVRPVAESILKYASIYESHDGSCIVKSLLGDLITTVEDKVEKN